MKSWADLTTWDYTLWTDKRIKLLMLDYAPDLLPAYKRYMADGRYCGAMNIARVLILHIYGGVWMDADTELIKDFADAPFMDYDGWVVHSPHVKLVREGVPGRLVNGMMGFKADHPMLDSYLDALRQVPLDDLHPSWRKTGGELMTRVYYPAHIDSVTMLPAHYFLPFNMRGKRIGPDTYANHRYGTTKGLYDA
jgi:mannosyltransferase OCH1-like enzyme